jgi:glycine cleavage system H protein
MTVLLILLTIVVLLAADYLLERSTARGHLRHTVSISATSSPEWHIPPDASLAHNHLWIRTNHHGIITVGIDELLGRLIRPVEQIHLPGAGSTVAPASREISFHQNGKVLSVAPPVTGRVVVVNKKVLQNPELAATDPYERGWLMKMQPEKNSMPKEQFLVADPKAWLRNQLTLMREFFAERLSGPQFATRQDGGEPVAMLLKQCNSKVWKDFEQSFTTLHSNFSPQI